MAKVEFTRVETDEEVEDISIKDGQLIYSKSGKTYMDYGDERIPTGSGGSSVDVDTEMSDSSTNAVQNKVIKEYVDNQVIISDTEPTDEENKIWIDTGEVGSQASEITNTYNTSENLGYSCNYVNNLFSYSTAEKIVGKWINGKPIYKKTFNFTVPAHTGETYQAISSYANDNILDVIYAEGIAYVGSHAFRIIGQSVAPSGSERTRLIGTGANLAFQASAFDVDMDCYATIYYTKTTD